MVKNRSQKMLNEELSIELARKHEMIYFNSHKVFKNMDQDLFGVANLCSKLTQILVSRIKASLPKMEEEAMGLLNKTLKELEQLGEPEPSKVECCAKYFEYTRNSVGLLKGCIDGQYKRVEENCRIYAQALRFYSQFRDTLLSSKPNFRAEEYKRKLIAETRKSRGKQLPGFLSMEIFTASLQQALCRWSEYSGLCLQQISKVLENFVEHMVSTQIPGNFTKLQTKVMYLANKSVQELVEETEKQIQQAIERELSTPFTNVQDYMKNVQKERNKNMEEMLQSCLEGIGFNNMTPQNLARVLVSALEPKLGIGNEEQEAEDMVIYLSVFWDVAATRFGDEIPKIINTHLLEQLASTVEVKLHSQDMLMDVDQFFKVSSEIKSKQRTMGAKQKRLEDAIEIIQKEKVVC